MVRIRVYMADFDARVAVHTSVGFICERLHILATCCAVPSERPVLACVSFHIRTSVMRFPSTIQMN
jgi:hypothetical protein